MSIGGGGGGRVGREQRCIKPSLFLNNVKHNQITHEVLFVTYYKHKIKLNS